MYIERANGRECCRRVWRVRSDSTTRNFTINTNSTDPYQKVAAMITEILESPSSPEESTAGQVGLRRKSKISSTLEEKLSSSMEPMSQFVDRISVLNVQTKMIALNARIEAGRCGGESGRTFNVVARTISEISQQTSEVAVNLAREFRDLDRKIHGITNDLVSRSRGERLSDLALVNIDLIDRNLYERSCDVRWWATDQSVVNAVVDPTDETLAHATRRMGQILDSYTVYFDIAIVNLKGQVLANGRPDHFPSAGTMNASEDWFSGALRTSSGSEYVQSEVGRSSLCSEERTIVFASTIRQNGQADGKPLGVLAVVFRWDSLAQTVVERTPLAESEWKRTRVCIVDARRKLLADTGRQFGSLLSLPRWDEISTSIRGYRTIAIGGIPYCVGHAASPGYETYRTGWYSLLLQSDLETSGSER